MRVLVLLCCLCCALPALAQDRPRTEAPVVSEILATQIALDRAGFSPGEIDGREGTNLDRARNAYERSHSEPLALVGDVPPLVEYTITDADIAGPFTPDIPDDMMKQAELDALGYKDIVEALAERFHCSPSLLKHLNPEATFAAGEQIAVPNVLDVPQPVAAPRESHGGGDQPADVTVTVSRENSSLTLTDGTGRVLFYAPVTTGSDHDPLPIGDWKVTGIQHDPKFHYNPALFWDAEPSHAKATIPPGPNNPVGVVWIDIDRPHYGLHGTPEPSQVGKTASHGCVRLTNWDASKVASLVHPGTPVRFVP
jgi:lipoprotein-anchoring transpeptidase ErfK/SrfK